MSLLYKAVYNTVISNDIHYQILKNYKKHFGNLIIDRYNQMATDLVGTEDNSLSMSDYQMLVKEQHGNMCVKIPDANTATEQANAEMSHDAKQLALQYQKSAISPLNLINDFLVGVTCLFRNDTKKVIQFNHCSVYKTNLPDVKEAKECIRILKVKDKVTSLSSGFKKSYMLRNKDPELCPILALAMLAYAKFGTIEGVRECTEEMNRRNKPGTPYDNDAWMLTPIFDYSYSTIYREISEIYKNHGINVRAKAHVGRKTGAQYANSKGVPHNEIKATGNWGTEDEKSQYNYYHQQSPNMLKVMAGLEMSQVYRIPRIDEEVPKVLIDSVFPWLEGYQWNIQNMFMKVTLLYFAKMLMQDLPYLFLKYPNHCFRFLNPFSDQVFIDFSHELLIRRPLAYHSGHKVEVYSSDLLELAVKLNNMEDILINVYDTVRELNKKTKCEDVKNFISDYTFSLTRTCMDQMKFSMERTAREGGRMLDSKLQEIKNSGGSFMSALVGARRSLNDQINNIVSSVNSLTLHPRRAKRRHDEVENGTTINVNTAEVINVDKLQSEDNCQDTLTEIVDINRMGENSTLNVANINNRVHRVSTKQNRPDNWPTYKFDTKMSYATFFSHWFGGCPESGSKPVRDIKDFKGFLAESKNYDNYKKYVLLEKVLKTRFEERRFKNTEDQDQIEKLLLNAIDEETTDYPRLGQVFKTPSRLSTFLIRGNNKETKEIGKDKRIELVQGLITKVAATSHLYCEGEIT